MVNSRAILALNKQTSWDQNQDIRQPDRFQHESHTEFLTALRTAILRHFNAVIRSSIVCSARQARIVLVVPGNRYSAAHYYNEHFCIFVFVREYSSSETQVNLLWKYLCGRSPIERVVANLEEGFPGFSVPSNPKIRRLVNEFRIKVSLSKK